MDSVQKAYEEASGEWTGLDWTIVEPIRIGDLVTEVDMSTMSSATDVFEELEGAFQFDEIPESRLKSVAEQMWESFEEYQSEVEEDALEAETLAAQAMEAYQQGDLEEAASLAEEVDSLEREYGDAHIWGNWASLLIEAVE